MTTRTKISLGALSLMFAGAVALPAFAAKTYDPTCIKSAIGTRDASIGSAFTTYYNSASTALTTRTTALQSAWDIADKTERHTALKSAWDTYKASVTTNKATLKSSREAAWSTYKTARIACGVQSDGNGAQSDNL